MFKLWANAKTATLGKDMSITEIATNKIKYPDEEMKHCTSTKGPDISQHEEVEKVRPQGLEIVFKIIDNDAEASFVLRTSCTMT